ncbi:peptide/nickel transport system ATP-binding protein [Devosia lucknowensis]|uniref:Peptide/nickel transport system ATP-binding protein n=1 Tax=Devosia lucknowensis TaxID=1096929 RepID=A0A1Y6G6H0_9HYPH|nr:ABC transporter ATP-binding protein [Devosia lucknowensis]SMQ85762.1 peptide/nickel transport system ATP-binding protein [Devosia lucknowensis]
MSSTQKAIDPTQPLIQVEDLWVRYKMRYTSFEAVRGVSFNLGREKLAIVGESGSGKSTVGRALLKLLAGNAEITARRLQFGDIDIAGANDRTMQEIRGSRVSMILQDPKFSLNPVIPVGEQIAEAYRVHHKVSRQEAKARTLDMLAAVQIRSPERVFGQYAHQVSGGMGQRIMIAMMLISDPDVIIADEPTSALDVTVRLQVLAILDDLVRERGMGLIFISHDLSLVRSFCDRVIIMYGGQIMETVAAADLDNVQHPYSRGLLNALPSLENRRPRLPVMQRDPSWSALRGERT